MNTTDDNKPRPRLTLVGSDRSEPLQDSDPFTPAERVQLRKMMAEFKKIAYGCPMARRLLSD